MASLVQVDPVKCNLSLTCIRTCPAKAIRIADGHAQVMTSRCIGCGQCVTMCAAEAIAYRSELDDARALFGGKNRVAAICDPAISGEFDDITDYRKFVAMIRALGFHLVAEAAFGVDLVALRYKALFDDFQGRFYISSKCPPVVDYVARQLPFLIENLAPIVPPWVAMSKVLHHRYGGDIKMVYITACVAAKNDVHHFAHTDGQIDAVMTFVELRRWFQERGITENSVTYSEFDPPLGRKGGLFPISHGLLQSVDVSQDLLTGNVLTTEGRTNFLQSLREFASDAELNKHLDLFYCRGCHMGPGTSPHGKRYHRRSQVIRYVNKRLCNLDVAQWEEDIQTFQSLDLTRHFKAQDMRLPLPSDDDIERVLAEMGKEKKEDRLGCGACGYPTCREFAIAHLQGLTNYEMCYTYTNKQLHASVAQIRLANEKLSLAREALLKSEEKARQEEQAAREAAATVTTMLDKLRVGVVIVNADLKIIESNKVFVEMLGDDARDLHEMVPGLRGAQLERLVPFHRLFGAVLQSGDEVVNRDMQLDERLVHVSVFTIRKHQVIGGIIRDLASPDIRRDEVVERARAVIRENLETVQQIAFLLGESASKTEKILNSIIDAQMTGGDHEPVS
ncbi:MAG: PAS domain-containing protein [Marinilabiliaceae bacterium]|nr:PAS domain-containing protein [Marinilabiliaceae bacterium]